MIDKIPNHIPYKHIPLYLVSHSDHIFDLLFVQISCLMLLYNFCNFRCPLCSTLKKDNPNSMKVPKVAKLLKENIVKKLWGLLMNNGLFGTLKTNVVMHWMLYLFYMLYYYYYEYEFLFSSIALKPINIRWIRSGS